MAKNHPTSFSKTRSASSFYQVIYQYTIDLTRMVKIRHERVYVHLEKTLDTWYTYGEKPT